MQEPNYPNFLEKSNPVFSQFHITLDNLFKSLRSDGVGSSSSHTEGISSEEEKLLWSSGVLNLTAPKGLLHTTFLLCRKIFLPPRCTRTLEHVSITVQPVSYSHYSDPSIDIDI